MEIKIIVPGLEGLTTALNNLANALGGKNKEAQVVTQQDTTPVQQNSVAQPIQQQSAQLYQQPVQQNSNYQQPPYQAQPQYQMQQNQQQFVPATQPIQQAPIQQAPVQNLPTSHTAQSFSQDQIAVAMTAMMDAGKGDAVFGILKQFGADTLMQVPKDQYATLATMLRGAGANI